MKVYLFVLMGFLSNLTFSQSKEVYKNYYSARKYYALGKIDSALSCINRFQKTKSFDDYGAKLKLKILHEIKSKKMLDEFFVLVQQTGITTDDLEYCALKSEKDRKYYFNGNSEEMMLAKYNTSRRLYLTSLKELEWSIEIEKILAQDQSIRILENQLNLRKDSATLNIYYKQLGIIDSINFEQLVKGIKQYGLPTVNKIGSNQYYLVLMAAMHLVPNPELTQVAEPFFDSIFYQTLLVGGMNPEYYMYFKDAVSRKLNDCQYYGYLLFKHPKFGKSLFTFCNDSETYINKLRSEIGAEMIFDRCRYEAVYCNYKKE